MKISKYTFFFNIDGKEYYTYNTPLLSKEITP